MYVPYPFPLLSQYARTSQFTGHSNILNRFCRFTTRKHMCSLVGLSERNSSATGGFTSRRDNGDGALTEELREWDIFTPIIWHTGSGDIDISFVKTHTRVHIHAYTYICFTVYTVYIYICRGYPSKRALSAMRKNGGYGPFGRIPSIYGYTLQCILGSLNIQLSYHYCMNH